MGVQTFTAIRVDDASSPLEGASVRCDRAYGLAAMDAIEETPEGFLKVPVDFGKAPMVLTYRTPRGPVRELVTDECLFDAASMATLADKPVGIEHPSMRPPLVTPKNVRQYMRGHVASVPPETRPGNGVQYARTYVVLTDAKAIALVKAARAEGKTIEVSPGYTAKVDNTPGTHQTLGDYDRIQRSRVYNHLALTVRGRSGPDVALKVDSYDLTEAGEPASTGGASMPQYLTLLALTLGVRLDSNDDEATATNKVLDAAREAKAGAARADSAEAEAATLLDALRSDGSDFKGRVDALMKGAKMDMKALADAMGVSREDMGHYMNGQKKMDASMFGKMAKTLGADMAELQKLHDAMHEDEDPEEKTDSDILAENLAWARRRQALEVRADSLQLKREDTDKLSNPELTKAVVLKQAEAGKREIKADGSDDYFSALFDALPEVKADSSRVWGGGKGEKGGKPPKKGKPEVKADSFLDDDADMTSGWNSQNRRTMHPTKANA